MEPLSISVMATPSSESSAPSTPSRPNSLTIRAGFRPGKQRTMFFRKVVFPAPRKPVMR